jgi:hypothetical protein
MKRSEIRERYSSFLIVPGFRFASSGLRLENPTVMEPDTTAGLV